MHCIKNIGIALALYFMIALACLGDVAIVKVKLPNVDKYYESHWRDAYAAELKLSNKSVETEKKLRGGRADIVTDVFAIEIDRAAKWHEAIGQAVHYANELKKKPMIALFGYNTLKEDQKKALEAVAKKRKIQITILESDG